MQLAEPIVVGVIDQRELFREGLLALLQKDPELAVIASPTEQSLELAPQVLIIDFDLLEVDPAIWCANWTDAHPGSRILVLTSVEDEQLLQTVIRAGAAGYMSKRASVAELLNGIREVAAGRTVISSAMTDKLVARFRAADIQSRPDPLATLTPREREVMVLLIQGLSNREISKALAISENTIKNHVAAILAKTGAQSRLDAVTMAIRLDQPEPGR